MDVFDVFLFSITISELFMNVIYLPCQGLLAVKNLKSGHQVLSKGYYNCAPQ